MESQEINSTEMLELTKTLFHQYFSGNNEPWLSLLTPYSMYIGHNSPVLFGETAIRLKFEALAKSGRGEILHEEYFPITLGPSYCAVSGIIRSKSPDSSVSAVTYFSIVYTITAGRPSIVLQHNSYEYFKDSELGSSVLMDIDPATREFILEIFTHREHSQRIAVRSGQQEMYLDPCSVLYVQSLDKRCEFVCMDRIVSSSESLKSISETLPDYFYPIHRSYIVNTRFIVAIRRFELELLSGAVLPIPERSYTKIKAELEKKINLIEKK